MSSSRRAGQRLAIRTMPPRSCRAPRSDSAVRLGGRDSASLAAPASERFQDPSNRRVCRRPAPPLQHSCSASAMDSTPKPPTEVSMRATATSKSAESPKEGSPGPATDADSDPWSPEVRVGAPDDTRRDRLRRKGPCTPRTAMMASSDSWTAFPSSRCRISPGPARSPASKSTPSPISGFLNATRSSEGSITVTSSALASGCPHDTGPSSPSHP
mmetsp:Transcript_19167/g.52861  ORF Transcript_19167/g.52861 Transcript_19167/m.52861 type:complete len:214 (-) Transcript_19167:603-1244(-)